MDFSLWNTTQSHESFEPPASFHTQFFMSRFLSHLNDDPVCCPPVCWLYFVQYAMHFTANVYFPSFFTSKTWKTDTKTVSSLEGQCLGELSF